MKKEFLIFFILLILFSLIIHFNEFVNYPITHIKNLLDCTVYGLGFLHPIVFVLVIYILIWIPRGIVRFFK